MIIPSQKLFKYIPGAEFDFRFQYLQSPSSSINPVNLTDYTPTWAVTNVNGDVTTYHLATSGESGVFFGGDLIDPTTGIIDLILIAADTTALLGPATYTFTVTPEDSAPIPLLFGSIITANSLFNLT